MHYQDFKIYSIALNYYCFVFIRQRMNGKLMSLVLVLVNGNYSSMSPYMIKSRNNFWCFMLKKTLRVLYGMFGLMRHPINH